MRSHHRGFDRSALIALGLSLALCGLGSWAEEPKKESADKPEDTESEVYTNEDLERMFGKSASEESTEPAAVAGPGEVDPVRAVQDELARERTRRKQLADAERKVQAAEAQVKSLEQRLLRISNPYLPRPESDHPQLGGMTDEEKREWEGMDNVERRKLTEKQLEQARKQLAETRKERDRLRSRS